MASYLPALADGFGVTQNSRSAPNAAEAADGRGQADDLRLSRSVRRSTPNRPTMAEWGTDRPCPLMGFANPPAPATEAVSRRHLAGCWYLPST